jgi:hypothetical protein
MYNFLKHKDSISNLTFSGSGSFIYSTGGGEGVANVTVLGSNFTSVKSSGGIFVYFSLVNLELIVL